MKRNKIEKHLSEPQDSKQQKADGTSISPAIFKPIVVFIEKHNSIVTFFKKLLTYNKIKERKQYNKISESNLPSINDNNYESIMKRIENAAQKYYTHIISDSQLSKDIIDRLKKEGYLINEISDNWLRSKIYVISWKRE
jgi:hypothetical protein